MPGAIIATVTEALTTIGVGAETAGFIAPVLAGAGTGALTSYAEHGDPLKGALAGGITGGFLGDLGPVLGNALGSATLGDVLAGTAGGALGSLATGGKVGTGALEGAGAGLVTGLTSGGLSGAKPAAPGTAAATALPGQGVPGTAPVAATDLTSSGGGYSDLTKTLSGNAGFSLGDIPGKLPADATSFDQFLSNPSLSTGWNVIKNNPSAILEAGGLARAAFTPPPGDIKSLTGIANRLNTQGQELSSYMANGTLPPGAQAAVDRATQAAVANIKGSYGNLGLGGSTMEVQAVNDAKMAAQAQAFQIATNLLNSGVQESQISAQLFDQIMQSNVARDASLSEAITGFAAAMGGGPLPYGYRPGMPGSGYGG